MGREEYVVSKSYEGREIALSVEEISTNIASNTSTIRWTLESKGGSSQYYTIYGCKAVVNGVTVADYGNYVSWTSGRFPASKGKVSGDMVVYHDSNGNASVSFSLSCGIYYSTVETYSETLQLTNLPRGSAVIDYASDFTDEENPSFSFSSPSGLSLNASLSCKNVTITRNNISNNGSYTFNLTDEERNNLRKACWGERQQFEVKLDSYGNGTLISSSTKDVWMYMTNCEPVFDVKNITYQDTNNKVIEITKDNQKIIRNLSNLVVDILEFAKPQKYATIRSFEVKVWDKTKKITDKGRVEFGTINTNYNTNIIVKVTDSRGFITEVEKEVTIIDYELPKAKITAKRLHNFEEETTIKVDADVSYVDGLNDLQEIHVLGREQYQFENWYDFTLENGETKELTLTRNLAYYFQFIIKDKFGSTTYNVTVNRGTPTFYLDTFKNSVGINCFPKEDSSLEIDGSITSNGNMNINGNLVVGGETSLCDEKVKIKEDGIECNSDVTINGKFDAIISDLFVIEKVTGSCSVPARGNVDGGMFITKSGYKPIALAGIGIGFEYDCKLNSWHIGTDVSYLSCLIYNTGSQSRDVVITAYVVYLKKKR